MPKILLSTSVAWTILSLVCVTASAQKVVQGDHVDVFQSRIQALLRTIDQQSDNLRTNTEALRRAPKHAPAHDQEIFADAFSNIGKSGHVTTEATNNWL